MMHNENFEILSRYINTLPVIDVHTHLDASHLSARGLHDIMLYHMVISELYSAGCPSGQRIPDHADDAYVTRRIEEAIPYLGHIRNTSCFWLMKSILSDLYQWHEPVTLQNWGKIDDLIKTKSSDRRFSRNIFSLANLRKACTELPLRGTGEYDDLLFYSLEWAFFMRNQFGVFDAPLYELEYAWQFDKPVRPLPVNIKQREVPKRPLKTVEDVKKAVAHYCNAIPYDLIVSTAHHISTDINYIETTDKQMQLALDNRKNAGQNELDIYASYLFTAFLNELEKNGRKIAFLFSLGAEPLPFETDSRLRQETIKQLAAIIARHPCIPFHCFLSSQHANQSLCSLCRQLPNLTLAGYWWHNFFPWSISRILDERLDMLPVNKQIGFFSDAYCVEWLYAKLKLVRSELANALWIRVDRGQYTINAAIEIAHTLLYKTPTDIFFPNTPGNA